MATEVATTDHRLSLATSVHDSHPLCDAVAAWHVGRDLAKSSTECELCRSMFGSMFRQKILYLVQLPNAKFEIVKCLPGCSLRRLLTS